MNLGAPASCRRVSLCCSGRQGCRRSRSPRRFTVPIRNHRTLGSPHVSAPQAASRFGPIATTGGMTIAVFTLQRSNAPTLQHFNASTLQRFNAFNDSQLSL